MSHQLISRSPDLKRLRDEGYDVGILANHLVVRDVPYLNSVGEIKQGILISTLRLAGDVTDRPDTHVANFAGEHPCDVNGNPIAQIAHASGRSDLGSGLIADHSFSNKPPGGYLDYYAKMTRYIEIISAPAHAIDPDVSARTYPVIESSEEESVFMYMDTASSRAEIGAVSDKLRIARLAILGTGGTGSYVLDLVAKTPVGEIHLYDGDVFSQHNAFRSPGAASIAELREKPLKVDYLRRRYSNMHRHIVTHGYQATEANVHELEMMDFVFICMDKGTAKQAIVQKLEDLGVPFVDVGMGIQLTGGSLGGLLKITTSTKEKRDHFRARVPFTDGGGNNEYDKNIQVADLNALNAALAVIKWKKLCGFYLDQEREHYSLFAIGGNTLINEDAA
jgi:hypothetical protein